MALPQRAWSGNAFLQASEPIFEWGELAHFKSQGQAETRVYRKHAPPQRLN